MRFFPFACIWNRFATALNLLQNAPNWCNLCKSSCHDVLTKLFLTNAPNPHHWTLLMFWCISFHLGAFGTVLLQHETWCKTRQTGAINAKVCATVLFEFFGTNAPDPYHWTLNSCFGVFLSVRVHFGTFSLLHETWCKTRQTGVIKAKVRATMSC